MEDNPPERSRRLTRVAPLLTIPIIASSLAFAQVVVPNSSGVTVMQVLVLVLLLLLSGFMAASHTALTAIQAWRARELKDEGTAGSRAFEVLERNPTRFMSTLLIANTAVNVAFTALVTVITLHQVQARGGGEPVAVLVAAAIAGVLILLFGEITPKSIAAHHPVAVAKAVIRPVYFLSVVMYPFGLAVSWITGRVLKLLRLQPTADTLMSQDELRMMLRSAEESGAIEPSEQQMIRGVIDLEETVVREVMTPRVDVIAVEGSASLADLQALVTEHGYSRLPVYGESIDDIIGMVYARDLLPYLGRADAIGSTSVADIARVAQYVPETLSVLNLLRDMRMRKNHMAVVVDEFGGTAGLVTLEDIIEEITGEIYDETDNDEVDDVVNLGDGSYRLQGSAHIEDVAQALGLAFDEDGDYDTVAGFLIGELDRIPQPGETVLFSNVRFTVESGDERRVLTVLASREEHSEEPSEEPSEKGDDELDEDTDSQPADEEQASGQVDAPHAGAHSG